MSCLVGLEIRFPLSNNYPDQEKITKHHSWPYSQQLWQMDSSCVAVPGWKHLWPAWSSHGKHDNHCGRGTAAMGDVTTAASG